MSQGSAIDTKIIFVIIITIFGSNEDSKYYSVSYWFTPYVMIKCHKNLYCFEMVNEKKNSKIT